MERASRIELGSQPDPVDHSFAEWQETRSILARLDGNLHDLRKYGFSFITALLAANSLIGQGTGGVTIPGSVKLVIFIVTLGLIVGVRVLDESYQLFESAVSDRAQTLEKRLNLGITLSISSHYKREAWWGYVRALYLAFVALATLLGLAVLYPNGLEMLIMVLAGIIAAITVEGVGRGIGGKRTEAAIGT